MNDFECSGNGWKVRIQFDLFQEQIRLYAVGPELVDGDGDYAEIELNPYPDWECDVSIHEVCENAKRLARRICGKL